MGRIPSRRSTKRLSNRGPRYTRWAEYPIGRSYSLVAGPIRTPSGGYPIRSIRRQLVGDGTGYRIGWVRIDPEPVGTMTV